MRKRIGDSKYGNIKTTVDGVLFDSKKESERYKQLLHLIQGGIISNLELQPEFPMSINGVKICKYRADFSYLEGRKRVVEDVKGMKTAMYRLKKKLLWALYGIEVREV